MEQRLQALSTPTSLKHYTAMMIASDGQVIFSGELLAADDADALAQAKLLIKDHAVDVWDGLRFVGLVDAVKQEPTEPPGSSAL